MSSLNQITTRLEIRLRHHPLAQILRVSLAHHDSPVESTTKENHKLSATGIPNDSTNHGTALASPKTCLIPGPSRSGRSCETPRPSEPVGIKGVQQNAQRSMAAAPSGAMTTSLREKSNRSPPCRNGNRKIASRDRRPKLAPKEPKCQKLPARD